MNESNQIDKISVLLADVGVLLISNGSSAARARRNVLRISEAYGYELEIFFSFSGIVLTLTNPKNGDMRTLVRTVKANVVDFNLLTEVSILTWDIAEKKKSYEDLKKLLKDKKRQPYYSNATKMIWIGVAVTALCGVFGGTLVQLFVAFLSGCLGFYVRLELLKRHYNVFMACLFASFVSVSVIKIAIVLGMNESTAALSSCILWLIPGVPLINGFLDILRGNIVAGWAKAFFGIMFVFMIAVGYYLSTFLFKLIYGI